MNLFQLAFKQIKSRPLSSTLSILLFTAGIAIISLMLLVRDGFEKQLERNAKGIDLVVGAKGSPLQLILSGIYHVDYPTGNIAYKEAQALAENPLIKQAIPQALGDNYKGYRIVGTTDAYVDHYGGSLAEGSLPEQPLEATIGAKVARETGLRINDAFAGVHGLIEGTGHSHDEHKYVVTGILAESGTVLDQLILTNIESVWEIHNHHHHAEEGEHSHEHADEAEHHHEHGEDCTCEHDHTHEHEANREITSLLISYKSPMGAITLPRHINQSTNMQAASPALEINRLFSLLGVGIEAINLIAGFIILISAFSIFISLLNSLKERKYELALMRVMGGGRFRLFALVLIEGISFAVIGYTAGFLISRFGMWILAGYAENNFHYDLSGWFSTWDIYLLSLSVFIGLLAAFIPALKAMKTDISKTLSE